MDVIQVATCLNCGHALTGPYCANCGQKKQQTDLPLREFLHETTHELTDWDGKIPSTLKTLLLEPGVLTADFLAGRRARWLLPLRLYLICSLAYFVSQPFAEAISHRSEREMARITITNPDGTTTLTPEGLEELSDGVAARVFGRDRLVRAAGNIGQLNREIQAVRPRAMFVLLPMFAFLTMLAWRRRLPRYPAHLYLALHLHSAWFAAMAFMAIVVAFITSTVVASIVGLAVLVYVIWYGLIAVRRIFGESWPKTLGKAAAVTMAYMLCFLVVSLAMLAFALTRM